METAAFIPKHLKRWIEQINYEGTNFDDYFVAGWRYFRCSPVERSNFAYIKEHLLDCGQEGVILPVFTDAVMSCRYYVMVHKDCERGLRMADMFAERIKRKGVLDPDAEKQIDAEAVALTWRKSQLHTRVLLCQEAGVSPFIARHEVLTNDSVIQLMSEAA